MTDFELPATRYATSGEVSIAYQAMGEGPIDIVMIPGIISHVEALHELPGLYRIPAPAGGLRARHHLRQAWSRGS